MIERHREKKEVKPTATPLCIFLALKQQIVYLAIPVARVSRITVTFTCPG